MRKKKKERPSLVNMMGLRRSGQMSARSKMGVKWLNKVKKTQLAHKDSMTLSVMHLSPLGSQLSFSNTTRIETVVDWDVVRRKFRELHGDMLTEKMTQDSDAKDDDMETDSQQLLAIDDTSSLVGSQATLINNIS